MLNGCRAFFIPMYQYTISLSKKTHGMNYTSLEMFTINLLVKVEHTKAK